MIDADKRTGAATAPQHMQALARANRVRLARAELKRQIARGEVSIAEVIQTVPWETESMTIGELLTSQSRWGRTRCRRFLNLLDMPDQKRLAAMSEQQRNAVAELLNERAARTAVVPDLDARRENGAQWDELEALTRRHGELADEMDQLTMRRDELIRGLSETGASRRSVAEVASLTVGRVQQIIDKSRTSPPEVSGLSGVN